MNRPAPETASIAASAASALGASVSPTTRRNQRIAFWATLVAAKALILFPIVYGHFA